MKKKKYLLFSVLVLSTLFIFTILVLDHLNPIPLERYQDKSQFILAQNGAILRAFTSQDETWRFAPQKIHKNYLDLLINYEDKYFYQHPGVNPISLIRAAWQWKANNKIISGGSTLTMQVARLLEKPKPRTIKNKIYQIVRALQLEAHYSKAEILNMYLTLAPFGGNVEGIEAGAWRYFGKSPAALTYAEAALLIALPQSPQRPDHYPEKFYQARKKILQRALDNKIINNQQYKEANQEPLPNNIFYFPFYAPHLARELHYQNPNAAIIQTTIDIESQKQLEKLAKNYIKAFPEKVNIAALLVDNKTHKIIAYLGSADFFAKEKQGQVDMVKAIRSPGSTLKPFIYGLAFDQHKLHPETLILDEPTDFNGYAPQNFSGDFQGMVTIRYALQQSLNVPAVKVLDKLGVRYWMQHLENLPITVKLTEKPSVAVALGGLGINLFDLTSLYVALANQGQYQPLQLNYTSVLNNTQRLPQNINYTSVLNNTQRLPQNINYTSALNNVHDTGLNNTPNNPKNNYRHNANTHTEKYPLYSQKTTLWLWDILADAPLPAGFTTEKFAYKTGTSYGFRDAWAIGYSEQYTLGVWLGRPDGTPNPGYYGRNAAAPFLLQYFLQKPSQALTYPQFPPVSKAPKALQYFDPTTLNKTFENAPEITFPVHNTEIYFIKGEENYLTLQAENGKRPLIWFINGNLIPSSKRNRNALWLVEAQGVIRVSVVDSEGRVDSVEVFVRVGEE